MIRASQEFKNRGFGRQHEDDAGPLVSTRHAGTDTKEFREYRHHRAILLTGLGLPLVFMMLPFLNLVGFDPDAPPDKVNLAVGQSMFVFFLTPAIVPAALAAYSIIGEKEQGTLEAILTLPLTDRQFLHAKIFAVAAPAVVASSLVYQGSRR
ncbi:MAG: ABC transporter permease subunit [Dehalococcoidia bacterium]